MPEIDYNNPPYEFIESAEHLKEVVKKDFKDKEIIAVDVEADSLDPYTANLLLVQIGLPEKAFVINTQKVDLNSLKPILEAETPLKILQNGKFDYAMLKVLAGIEMKNIFDTMLAERILTAGVKRENSLGALARNYLGVELDKDWESFEWIETGRKKAFTKRHLNYAANDVLVLFPIFEQQFKKLEKEKLLRISQLEFALIPVVAEMEIRGSYIDKKKWREHINQLRRKRNEIAQKIQDELRPLYKHTQVDLFGNHVDVINLNSTLQILEAFRKVGIDLPSTGEAILRKTNHPLAKMLLEYRGYEKLISAFGENLLAKIHKKTGRLHPDYMQIGADSGRFACGNPNLQQIPKDSAFRSCFIAPHGYKLVTADYSQAELRIMAEASGDPAFINAYKEDQDLHALTASQMFGIPIDKVTKEKRFQAKSINFGLMYGRGAGSLAGQLGVSIDEAKKLLNIYFKKYKKVKDWLDKVGKDAVRKGYAVTLGGRKRWFNVPDKSDPNYDRLVASIERQGKNTPIQGTNADMTKYALVFIYDKIRKMRLDAYPIHMIHDEIVIEVKEDQAQRAKKIIEEEMARAHDVLVKKVPGKVEAVVSDVWEH